MGVVMIYGIAYGRHEPLEYKYANQPIADGKYFGVAMHVQLFREICVCQNLRCVLTVALSGTDVQTSWRRKLAMPPLYIYIYIAF